MSELASIIDICNMALTLIGEPSITSLDEGTVVSNKCDSLWVPSRDFVQDQWDWPECIKRATLVLSTDLPNHGWAYKYALPSDYLHLIDLYEHNDWEADFSIEGGFLFTDHASANISYVGKNSDPTTWSTYLVECVKHWMASQLSIAIAGARADMILGRLRKDGDYNTI